MQKKIAFAFILTSAGLLPVGAQAQISGTVDATITLEAGCSINGVVYDDGDTGATFGDLDFGTQNTLFTEADAQILSAGSGFTIQCSNGVAPTVSFDAGQNDGSGAGPGLRAMENAAVVGQFVTYNLYSDAARSTIIPIGGDITLLDTGVEQTVDVYGRAFGEDGLSPGDYTDVITVVVEL